MWFYLGGCGRGGDKLMEDYDWNRIGLQFAILNLLILAVADFHRFNNFVHCSQINSYFNPGFSSSREALVQARLLYLLALIGLGNFLYHTVGFLNNTLG